jgi:hypothetical protein
MHAPAAVPNFTLIAEGLDVARALRQLAALPALYWNATHGDADLLVPLLGPDGRRRQEERLPAVWTLIEQVHAIAARDFGDTGTIDYARIGKLPAGRLVPPHADGHDGVWHRRYQIMLASGPGAMLVLDGESRNLRSGEAWQIDTRKIHSVANPDSVPRINILFDSRAAT